MATLSSIVWEAPEHHHIEKGGDWYWALGIIAVAGAGISVFFGNALFAVVLILGALAMAIVSLRGPQTITFALTSRGIRVDEELHPFTTLESFYIDEEDPHGPQLLVKTKSALRPLIIIPLPPDDVDEIDAALAERLPEEHLEESFAHRLLEFFGF